MPRALLGRSRGGAGSDALTGNGGNDFFVFDSLSGSDTISDFTVVNDQIQLSLSIFGGVGTVGNFDATTFVTAAGVPVAGDVNDRILYNSTNGQLFFDADGSGSSAAILIATLTGNPVLAASDFEVIS